MKPVSYWSFDRCAEDALKYETKTSWRNASSAAHSAAYKRGWMDDCCAHMVPRRVPSGHWTKDRCREDAERYASRSDWSRRSSGAYDAARRNGWVDECCSSLARLKIEDGYWTQSRCVERARDFSAIGDWQRECPGSFDAARHNGSYDDCVAHMRQRRRRGSITAETCAEDALKYSSRSEWKSHSSANYTFARTNGLLSEITAHMEARTPKGYWTYDLCSDMARPYKSRNAWRKGHPKSYDAARVAGWIDEIATAAGMLRSKDTSQREFAQTCRGMISDTDIDLREEVGRLAGQRSKVDMVFYRAGVPFLAVEYQGPYWHSEARGKDKHYHRDRMNALRAKNIRLITVHERDKSNPVAMGMIRSALGLTEHRVRASKCSIVMVGDIESREFYQSAHIAGGGVAGKDQLNIGLTTEGRLAACMTFVRSTDRHTGGGNYDWCLHRFATAPEYRVHGAASRMVKRFRRIYPEASIVAHCDLQFFTGGMYRNLGFEMVREDPSGYGWVRATTALDRHHTRKKCLPDLLGLGYDPALSETENMKRAGYSKIWDCGKAVYAFTP